jgi:hypothetical protein
MSEDKTDARRYPRFDMLDVASIYLGGKGEPVRTIVVNVGLAGVQLRSKSELPVGAGCEIHLDIQLAHALELRGEVLYSSPVPDSDLYMSGLRFMPAGRDERQAIAEYVLTVFQRQGERANSPQPFDL